MNCRRQRDDRGAVAVLVGILAIVLFGIGAFAVDIGQAYAKRSLLQTNVDLAAMASAAHLDGDADCDDSRLEDEQSEAESFLNTNRVPGTGTVDLGGAQADLDGFIDCDPWKVNLWAPKSHVDLTLGRLLVSEERMNEGIDVPAYAAAGVLSPKMGVWPVYAAAGCDMGPQTLIDLAGGLDTPVRPTLSPTSTTPNNSKLTELDDGNADPDAQSTPVGTPATLKITGSQLRGVTTVGFTRESAPADVGGHEPVTLSPVNTVNNEIAAVQLPSNVYNTEAVWWVRVSKDNGATWSDESSTDGAQPYVVGEPTLRCVAGSTSGNFGVVNLPNAGGDGNWEETATNIAAGLEYTLQTYPGAPSAPTPCAGLAEAATVDDTAPGGDPINCLDTQGNTGIATNAVTAGLVTGVDGGPEGLLDADPTPLCGGSRWTPPSSGGTSYPAINDDRLECFLTRGATVSSITTAALPESLEGVLAPEILDSPRFFWVPVFSVDPEHGSSSSYAIQDFRPAFLTGADVDANIHNGMTFTASGVVKLEVVFFNEKALPQTVDPTRETMDYLGVGPKIIRMVE